MENSPWSIYILTHRLGLDTNNTRIYHTPRSQKVELRERHDSGGWGVGFSLGGYYSERGGSVWVLPFTQKLRSDGITQRMDGLARGFTRGLLDLVRSSHLCCICRPERRAGVWTRFRYHQWASVFRNLHWRQHSVAPTSSSSLRRQWASAKHFSCTSARVRAAVVVCLLVCWPGLM